MEPNRGDLGKWRLLTGCLKIVDMSGYDAPKCCQGAREVIARLYNTFLTRSHHIWSLLMLGLRWCCTRYQMPIIGHPRSMDAFRTRLDRREGLPEPLERAEWLPDALEHSYQPYGSCGTSYAPPDGPGAAHSPTREKNYFFPRTYKYPRISIATVESG